VLAADTRARFEAVSRTGDRDFCQLLVQMQVRYSSVFTYSSLLGFARHIVEFERIESQMARTIRGGGQMAGWGEDSAVATGEVRAGAETTWESTQVAKTTRRISIIMQFESSLIHLGNKDQRVTLGKYNNSHGWDC